MTKTSGLTLSGTGWYLQRLSPYQGRWSVWLEKYASTDLHIDVFSLGLGTVFGYFELLALGGDVSLLEVEEIRIRSFKDIMVMAGVDYDLLVDMFDNTWELFAEVKKAIQENKVDDAVVLQIMNDPVVSESIVYHFKVSSLPPDANQDFN